MPATLAAVAVAFALRADFILGAVVAALVTSTCAALALASVAPQRLIWSSASLASLAVVCHAAFPVALFPTIALDLPRAALARPIDALVSAPESAILLGIVLGERGAIPPDLARAFAASGTTHLLAISGFNMTLVASAVALALHGRAGPVARAVAAVGAIVAYSLLVGLSPSVLRAALMSAVAASGVISGRRAATANALCAAVTAMLICDPSAVDDIGLQLSALATAGLIIGQGPLADRLGALPPVLRAGIATTLAATLPTLPVVAGAFGRLSIVAVAANLICVPLFPLLMLAGAATSVAGAVSLDLARPVAVLAWAVALVLRVAVETFASLPFAALSLPPGPLTGVLVGGTEVAVLVAARRARIDLGALVALRRRALLISAPRVALRSLSIPRQGIAVLLTLAIAPAAVLAAWPAASAVRVIALDVGQGDAYLVEVAGAFALVDGGPDPSRVIDELAATLAPWQRRIDLVALTHAHTDHGAGLLAVIDRYDVGVAIEPEGLNPSPLTDLWAAGLAKRGVPRRAVHAGQRLALGDASIEILAPDPDVNVDVPSLVLRITRGPFSVLFTGDAVDAALGRLLEHPDRLRSRIYVPPHHGAETPFAIALRTAARPEAALISVGAGNRYGHPTPQTLAALAGIPTYRTDQDGTVEIALDGPGLVVRTHANGLPPPRRGSIPFAPSRQ